MPAGLCEEQGCFNQVSQLVDARAEIYHIGFLTLDRDGEWLVFRGGKTGDATNRFLESGYRLNVKNSGRGPYQWHGRVIRDSCIMMVDTDNQKVSFLLLLSKRFEEPNIELEEQHDLAWGAPLLPETRWELFLPLRYADRVRGAAWIQISDASGFDMEDLVNFQGIMDQVALRIWPTERQAAA